MSAPSHIRSRTIQRADWAAVRSVQDGVSWERPQPFDHGRLFEGRNRIIGASCAQTVSIRTPTWVADPLPEITLTFEGDQPALLGHGLYLSRDATPAEALAVFRLARTLAADELGVRWTMIRAPLPTKIGYPAAAIAQQIGAGAIAHLPISVPLSEGFWPIGIEHDALVLVRRNDAF